MPLSTEPSFRAGLCLLELDPVLAGGHDPLEAVTGQLKRMKPGALIAVVSSCKPEALFQALPALGYRLTHRHNEASCVHVLEVQQQDSPIPADLTELSAPEPLHCFLEAAAGLAAGAAFVARLPRYPRMLFPQLDARGLRHESILLPSGYALVRAWKAQ